MLPLCCAAAVPLAKAYLMVYGFSRTRVNVHKSLTKGIFGYMHLCVFCKFVMEVVLRYM